MTKTQAVDIKERADKVGRKCEIVPGIKGIVWFVVFGRGAYKHDYAKALCEVDGIIE